ncbi:MAG: GNAT family N-acetyltransferase [Planctomycetaceae bacterium]|nr:GNAT family N-acetyltransferase [Planctomycetaceae bacterium]
MTERYFKRYRMEFDLRESSIPEGPLPEGFEWIPWDPALLEAHAITKAECFAGETDSILFPCLSHVSSCRRLMTDISSQSNFLPEATWLIQHPNQLADQPYCGTIQGMRRACRLGAVQNVGVTPEYRGLGLGTALVCQALRGYAEAGMHRVYLDVTASNLVAVTLYHKIGFRIRNTSYLAAAPQPIELS